MENVVLHKGGKAERKMEKNATRLLRYMMARLLFSQSDGGLGENMVFWGEGANQIGNKWKGAGAELKK